MSPWDRLLQQPQRRAHLVQLYDADRSALAGNVGRYLGEALKSGDNALVVATPEHWDLFSGELTSMGVDVARCERDGQLLYLDALDTLRRFMSRGQPDWPLFERTIGAALRRFRTPPDGSRVRAYGEMVALLWKTRQFGAAVRLEQLWNKLLAHSSFTLYCSYAIDVFGKDFHPDALDALLSAHTHLVPAEPDGTLELAFNRALHEVLGPDTDDLKRLIRANHRPSWAVMPDTESMILWIRKSLPKHADEIIERARVEYVRSAGN